MLDYPGKLSSIIFTQGCNFNCVYCHNKDLILRNKGTYSADGILDFLKERKDRLDAVVITGGEPTLQPDLIDYMKKIKKLGYLIKLDTNGSRPDVIKKALAAKVVDYIAMDIKAPLKKYWMVANTNVDINQIEKSISIIRNSGIMHEFRTTVPENILNESDLFEIKSMAGSAGLKLQKCNEEFMLSVV